MKKMVLMLGIVCTLMSYQTAMAGCTTTKVGGGAHGFNEVDEIHKDGTHTLTCKDPGWSPCDWTFRPSCAYVITKNGTVSVSQYIEPQIESNILLEIPQGIIWLDDEIFVSWSGTDIYNYTFTINN